MLSKEDNELLCRVGPGTATGALLRHYWLPFLFDWEIETDREPQRVRLLGEDLIAFRDSMGRIGLLGDHCAHWGASLFFGRNEDCGLRCVYHGWKYDATGRCVDMPNEPPRMGQIWDRTQEHLGTSDSAIISVRRRLIRASKELRDHGTAPAEIDNPEAYMVRADALLLPAEESWLKASEKRRRVLAGVNPSCPA